MKHTAMQKIRASPPSKGRKKRRHALHKPQNILTEIPQTERVKQMLSSLREHGWTIRFKVEAVSPMGFQYAADGPSGDEAFLKAFGVWKKELSSFAAKIPAVVKQIQDQETPPLSEMVREMLEKYGETLNKPAIKVDPRIYRRIYMKAYRYRNAAAQGIA